MILMYHHIFSILPPIYWFHKSGEYFLKIKSKLFTLKIAKNTIFDTQFEYLKIFKHNLKKQI